MRKIVTPPGLNERLLAALEQELRPLEQEMAETERYLRRFRAAPLPQAVQGRILRAVDSRPARHYLRPSYYRRAAVAACLAAVLLAGALLYPQGEAGKTTAATPCRVPVQPVYTVHDSADNSDFSLRVPVVFVADNVL